MKDEPMKQRRHRNTISRTPIVAHRVRTIEGGFAFIEHRFLHRGFFAHLNQQELVLYLLLVLAADRQGISFYGDDAICSLCAMSCDEYLVARNVLIAKNLIAYDGRRFQVLSLPERPDIDASRPLESQADFEAHDPTTIRRLIRQSLDLCASEPDRDDR
jgi:hypothetical protein